MRQVRIGRSFGSRGDASSIRSPRAAMVELSLRSGKVTRAPHRWFSTHDQKGNRTGTSRSVAMRIRNWRATPTLKKSPNR
jgi:hypothetical protein